MSGESDPPDDESIIRVPGTDRVFHRGRMLVVLLSILAMTMMAISAIPPISRLFAFSRCWADCIAWVSLR